VRQVFSLILSAKGALFAKRDYLIPFEDVDHPTGLIGTDSPDTSLPSSDGNLLEIWTGEI
jgi:hypothetical protein